MKAPNPLTLPPAVVTAIAAFVFPSLNQSHVRERVESMYPAALAIAGGEADDIDQPALIAAEQLLPALSARERATLMEVDADAFTSTQGDAIETGVLLGMCLLAAFLRVREGSSR